MRLNFCVLTLAVAMAHATVPPAAAQASTPSAAAVRARTLLGRAADAMGGVERLRRLVAISRELAGLQHDPGQGVRPVAASVKDPAAIASFELTHAIDYGGRRLSMTRNGAIVGGQPYSLRTVLTPTLGFTVNDTLGTINDFPAPRLGALFATVVRMHPEALLLEALDRAEHAVWTGTRRVANRDCDIVTFQSATGESIDVALDTRTALPVARITVPTNPNADDGSIEMSYSDWRAVDGLHFPFAYQERRDGVLYQSWHVLNLDPAPSLARIDFTRPERSPAPRPVGPPVRVGPGVHVLLGQYNSLLVEFADHVVVIEPGASDQQTQANLRLIDSLVPGKPIRFVVATHFHSDHIAGIRGYLARGATVLAPPDAEAPIRAVAAAPRARRPDAPPATTQFAFRPMTTRTTLEDATQRLELIPVGPNPHAEHILVVHIPAARVLFQGDMLDLAVAPGAVSMGGDDTVDLLRKVDSLALNPETVVPVHGRIGTYEDLRRAAARRAGRNSP